MYTYFKQLTPITIFSQYLLHSQTQEKKSEVGKNYQGKEERREPQASLPLLPSSRLLTKGFFVDLLN